MERKFESKSKYINLGEDLILGIAGAIGGITVGLCTFPFGRTICPEQDGKMVFEVVHDKLSAVIKKRRVFKGNNLVE